MDVLKEINTVFDKWLVLGDPDYLAIVAAAVVGNRMPSGDPVWLMICGPPGSGKSEIVNSLEGIPHTVPVGSVTPHSFISGFRKTKEPGILERLEPGKGYLFLIKDFTTILSLRSEEKMEVLSQLREIYDGKFTKSFGTGKNFTWHGKIGVIGGVTNAYEREMETLGSLGERNVLYRPTPPDPYALAERAARNVMRRSQMVAELKGAMSLLSTVPTYDFDLDLDTRGVLATLAGFAVTARTPVHRDWRTREILEAPSLESPGRLTGQLSKLLKGLMLLNNPTYVPIETMLRASVEEAAVIGKVALSCVPKLRLKILIALLQKPQTVRELAELVRLPETTVRRVLEELTLLGLTDTNWEFSTLTRAVTPLLEAHNE